MEQVLRWLLIHTAEVALALTAAGCGSSDCAARSPVVASQPQDTVVTDGTTARFEVTAEGLGPLTYQWRRDGAAITGAMAASYRTPLIGVADSGRRFSVVVSNPSGSATSREASLTVHALPPAIVVRPTPATVAEGSEATLRVHATGSEPLAYQWLRGGVPISGATLSTLTFAPVSAADGGVGYAVRVTNIAGAATSDEISLTVVDAGSVIPVTECQEITSSGTYLLQVNRLTPRALGACLFIHDARDVHLDCGRRAVFGWDGAVGEFLEVRNVHNFSVRNCVFSGVFSVSDSSSGRISDNTLFRGYPWFDSMIWTNRTTGLVVDGNVLGRYSQVYGHGNTILSNRMAVSQGEDPAPQVGPAGPSAVIRLQYGSRNMVVDNDLDGDWDPTIAILMNQAAGGVVLADEQGALVHGNRIANVYDCGVETVGTVTSAAIRGNHILGAGVCGIGGTHWWTGLAGATIARNVVEGTRHLFVFKRPHGLRPAGSDPASLLPADSAVFFEHNLFEANTHTAPAPPAPYPHGSSSVLLPLYDRLGYVDLAGLAGERAPTEADFRLSDNVFRDNQLPDTLEPPWFGDRPQIPGAVVDGGGNTCGQAPVGYPLACR